MASAAIYGEEGVFLSQSTPASAGTGETDWITRFESFVRDLHRLVSLEHNWDSYEGRPSSISAVRECERFIGRLGPSFELPEVYPIPSGGVGLEWRRGGTEIAVEVEPNGLATFLVETEGIVEAKGLSMPLSKLLIEWSSVLARRIPRAE